jgi:predicted small lipoprotein YifL
VAKIEPVRAVFSRFREDIMRRVTVLALALGLALSAAACGKKGPLDKPQREKQDEEQTALALPR